MHNQRALQAFSLVELSVVLVIIGLLTGGVLVGQYMIRQAEMQSVVNEFAKFKAANIQFASQYDGKPGDLNDAESYFGTDPNGCPTNSVRTPRKETCNGNGDRSVADGERFRAWQQLAAAELIQGSFSGVQGAGGANHAVAGQNVPAGRLAGSTYFYHTLAGLTAGNTNYFPLAIDSEAVMLGGAVANTWPHSPLFTPRQQAQLDSKMDDGKPASGGVYALRSALNPLCTTSDAADAEYNFSKAAPACSMLYLLDY